MMMPCWGVGGCCSQQQVLAFVSTTRKTITMMEVFTTGLAIKTDPFCSCWFATMFGFEEFKLIAASRKWGKGCPLFCFHDLQISSLAPFSLPVLPVVYIYMCVCVCYMRFRSNQALKRFPFCPFLLLHSPAPILLMRMSS